MYNNNISYLLCISIIILSISCKREGRKIDKLEFIRSDSLDYYLFRKDIKPLNGLVNGPLYAFDGQRFTMDATAYFMDLNIPIIRYHDVEYLNKKNKAVNISAIFPDTNADESLPSSYHFVATDSLMKSAKSVGAKIIFRLGENVQNIGSATAKNTPPADFDQWARVAERIIAHYEDGWSNGYHYQDIMWEVWNEPTNNGSWSGSLTDYALFYKTVYRFIKKRHPNIDISPAYISDPKKRIKLYQYLKENNLGISHCFAHYYASNFSSINDLTKNWKKELDEFGFDADVLINEWNYLSEEDGWYNLIPTYYAIQNPKAAVWYAKQMIYMQAAEHLAGAVYYTSDMPGFWTGLYKQDSKGRYVKLPTYDVFKYFGKLYELGTEIRPSNVPNGILTLAASNGEEIGIIVVNDTDKLRKISINIGNLTSTKKNIVIKGIKYHTLNENIEVLLSPYDVSFISIY